MKICHVVPWFPSPAASTIEARQAIFGYRQVVKLTERGHEFKVISLRWKNQEGHETIGDRVEVFRLPYIFQFPRIRYPVPELFGLSAKIRDVCQGWQPDLLSYSHINFLTVLPIFYLKSRLRVPTVVATDCFPGISWSYGDRMVDAIGYLYSNLVSRRVLGMADGIQFMSSQLLDYTGRLGIDEGKVFTVPRGVDTELFQPRGSDEQLKSELGIGPGDTVILNVGRLDRVKGVDYLIRALKQLLSRHPQAGGVKLLLVGGGSLRQQYQELARPFGQNIIFLGFRTDVPRLMNIAHIFVLPSLSEGAANAAMEASASGLPVVATAVGEVPQIVADGETGLLVRPRDIDGLARQMERLIGDPALGRRMGEAGRRRMEQRYSWEIICGKLEESYRKVIERAKTHPASGNG